MKLSLYVFTFFVVLAANGQVVSFNGQTLQGWYRFVITKGINNDPEKVFQVENNLLHISGKEFGYICTEKEFTNFHLIAEFKWGTKKYPPRDADTTRRDNGICFYFSSGIPDKVWPKSVECQIQEGDVGDIWLIDYTTINMQGRTSKPDSFHREIKKTNAEKPTGEWNHLEIIAKDGKITYLLNGVMVNEGTDISVRKGKILVQSEGAEIYYRKIEIAEL